MYFWIVLVAFAAALGYVKLMSLRLQNKPRSLIQLSMNYVKLQFWSFVISEATQAAVIIF